MAPKQTNYSPLSKDLLFASMSTALLLLDSDMNVVDANQATENLLNTSVRRIRGLNAFSLFAASGAFINALKQSKHNEFNVTKSELELVIPHLLRVIKVDCIFSPIVEKEQILVEMTQIDEKLRVAKEENIIAQQDVLKVLVRGFAHEVKNPLGGIRGAAQLLERELPYDDLKEYTDVIIGETDRLQKLVDEMLGPNKPMSKEPVNIHKVTERVRQLVLAESGGKLVIVRDYDPSLPEIFADADQLIQSILNIVRNAKQALDDQGEIVLRTRSRHHVTIGQRHHRLVVSVEIIDNGPGIEANLLDKIFYPMITSRAEGTGLGLSIAQTLIGQHGGIIECSSKSGETNFTLLLPINAKENS